ncbi:hypothetical protein LBMAG42_03810 [Deltaproteobacteria bacterium]|nr:hypothetical protein LBMAG42_03810 [Deltaproteobacteria bacterium]
MATCYTRWTVLPHRPIEKHTERLWTVSGLMENGTQRTMSVIRLEDSRLLLHNAIALTDEEMAEIDGWGTVAGILVPNGFHRMDCRIMQERYPQAKVYAPAAAAKAVAKATPVHGTFADAPQDHTVRVAHLAGIKDREGVIEVASADGVSLVFNDMIMNIPPAKWPTEWMVGPSGRVSIPRFARWFFVSDTAALRTDLERIAERSPSRLVPGHGTIVTADVAGCLREAAALL